MLLSLLTVKIVVQIKLYYSLRVFHVDVLVSAGIAGIDLCHIYIYIYIYIFVIHTQQDAKHRNKNF
jgi:hypothetical protein